ncbi:MAG: phosphoribosylanthranilate isomerase [Alphaproteobacteria bacterium]|nr:phosphoribosylanthranilate isomerase [Alphaproteobacteria bacterium]
MSVTVKICGLRDANAVAAAVSGGARYAGFVFYRQSPRVVDAQTASLLIDQIPDEVIPVGLFVNPTDDEMMRVLRAVRLKMIQLHGNETPERVAAVKKLTRLPVIKAVGIATAEDVEAARIYEPVADMLLLDAKAEAGKNPGGNAVAFDWSLLGAVRFKKPWMLAGGLHVGNLDAAVAATGASIVDVSSGVEDAPGHKNPQKIRDFLTLAAKTETCY